MDRSTTTLITQVQTAAFGTAVLSASALLVGASHYFGTAKRLTEDGIDPAARLRAVPVAAKALAFSTVASVGLAAVVLGAWHAFGGRVRKEAEVAGLDAALQVAQHQRVSKAALKAVLLLNPPTVAYHAAKKCLPKKILYVICNVTLPLLCFNLCLQDLVRQQLRKSFFGEKEEEGR